MTATVRRAGRWLALALTVAASGVVVAAAASPAQAAPATGVAYQLVVTKSGKCVDVPGASADNGALLQQWGCTANS
ncbi:RICIN domain-containing protein, partial [Catellatospora coxensis]